MLKQHQLYDKFTKYELWLKEVMSIEHVISSGDIFVDPSKVEIVLNWEAPKKVIEIYSFLGMARYYRWFIKDFSMLANPMIKLT